MELKNIPPHEYQLLLCLSKLPEKIIAVHGLSNATEFILHALCKESGLPVQRIAYFVDNPDFDWCKGVAGFASEEQECSDSDVWKDFDYFTRVMQEAPFNQKIRSLSSPSFGPQGISEFRERIKQELPFNDPVCFSSGIKNDNIGILVVDELPDQDSFEESLHSAGCLLGMCPVF